MYATISTGKMFGRKNMPRQNVCALILALSSNAIDKAMRLIRIVAVTAYSRVKP